MKTYYARITGLSPALDGLKAEVLGEYSPDDEDGMVEIIRLAGCPVEQGGLFIWSANLSPIENIDEEELALDNPFGSLIDSRSWVDGQLVGTVTLYMRAVAVNVRNSATGRTLHDQVYWGDDANRVWDYLTASIGKVDLVEFLFGLREI